MVAILNIFGALFSGGSALVKTTTSWKVSQRGAGANMSVDVAAGSGLIPQSGSFPFAPWSDATVNKTVTTSNPSNPRNDIVVAYIDLAVPSTAVTNSLGALKFAVVAGTPAASPADPSDPTIQSAVGSGNPWVKLARVLVPTSSSTVTDGNITDLRQPISFAGRLWGGSSNTNGHTVPNATDGTVLVSTDDGTLKTTLFSPPTPASWAWSSWTPTLTNITIGNGTVVAKYTAIGKTIFYQLSIVAGSTTSSSGLARFSLPANISSNYVIGSAGDANNGHIGEVVILNASTASFPSTTRIYDADELSILVTNAATGSYALHTDTDMDATAVPFQFLTGDKIFAWGFYEAA